MSLGARIVLKGVRSLFKEMVVILMASNPNPRELIGTGKITNGSIMFTDAH